MGPSRNSEEKEVDLIVINPLHNDIIRMRKECKEVDKSLLQYIIEDFTYEDIKTPMYPEKNGEAGYPTTLITVGLENDEDWNLEGKPVKVIKKAIKRPEYIKIKKLVDIIVTM